MKTLVLMFVLACAPWSRAEFLIAENGAAKCTVIVDPSAGEPEQNAARELVSTLKEITGAEFKIAESAEGARIFAGPGAAARAAFSEIKFDELGSEQLVMKTKDGNLLLAGGKPRGTLYAISRFLQDQCGVRWWTPWASRIPKKSVLKFADVDVKDQPAFEYREPYWYPAFDAQWAWRNGANGQSSRLQPAWGDCIRYKGFVHTFYPLVPPAKYFGEHPEWYSLIKGKRSTDRAQLCTTNPKLREFMVERVKEWLRESPEARIISVSQNDWFGACECPDCKALDDAEGTHAATMLTLVNYIAEKIEPEFPQVAVDTLAYQYTRKPPKTIKPRPNVIVRLCSIECNFREPLDHPVNKAFADDIRGWEKLCQRLYIWDYTTDFGHYVQPHPNWFNLGANLRFFQEHGVRGVFEQGAYQSHGSEMAELRAWVLAKLLWNPHQDDRTLIQEFVEGYYGTNAAPFITHYMEVMREASTGQNLTCFSPITARHLKFAPMAKSEALWRRAEAAAREDGPEFLERVQVGHLPLGYVWLSRWKELRSECEAANGEWPFAQDRKETAAQWLKSAQGKEGKPWSKITLLNEGGLRPEKWAERFQGDAK